jgi:hypothetical protein
MHFRLTPTELTQMKTYFTHLGRAQGVGIAPKTVVIEQRTQIGDPFLSPSAGLLHAECRLPRRASLLRRRKSLGNPPQRREMPPQEDEDKANEVEDNDERDAAGSPPPTSSSAYSVASSACGTEAWTSPSAGRTGHGCSRACRARRRGRRRRPPCRAPCGLAWQRRSCRTGCSPSQAVGSHAGAERNESRGERVARFAFSFGWEAKCISHLGLLLEAVFATQNTVHDPKWVWVPLLELVLVGL